MYVTRSSMVINCSLADEIPHCNGIDHSRVTIEPYNT